jgi:glucan 1,3-beta-glucosidase
LNTVRIPVGYWITGFDNSGGGDPDGWKVYAPGAINYLDKAIREWAPRNNLLVLISFHAAKGSQNGADHSAPKNHDKAYWSSYPENVNNALDAVEWLARRYNNDVSFLGIGLLNEPRDDQNEAVLKQYYYDAYGRIRAIPSDCLLMTSPLLSEQDPRASGNWNSFMPPPGWQGIRHEWHRYQVWDYDSKSGWTPQKLIDYANNQLANDIKDWNGNWLFIGEWSIATAMDMPDDNTLRSYARAQLGAFSKAKGGWTYWTWKFYNDDGSSRNQWSMKSMIKMGLLWML